MATKRADLTSQQVLAVEQLAAGATVVHAADAVGVARETIHRWAREDWVFRAAVNRARRELHDAVERRLLAVANRAMTNVAEAVERGDLSASLTVLKGLGILGGHLPPVGSGDPAVLAEEAELLERETNAARTTRSLFAHAL